jgi:putative ABC transport system ATP-binding protein
MSQQIRMRIRRLTKTFHGDGSGSVHALRDFALDIAPGEFIVIVGPNGSGKSTLLNLLAGDYLPDGGEISLLGSHSPMDWLKMPRWQRAAYLARVHQDPRRGTVPGMTVWENLRLAASWQVCPSPFRFGATGHNRAWFCDRLAGLGLADKIDSRVGDLSHGQRQLLALELAMLRKPAFLLADEHAASLDQANAHKCLDATVRLGRELLTTVIMVTHNLMDALSHGDRLVVMREGRVAKDLAGEQKQKLALRDLLDLCGYVM